MTKRQKPSIEYGYDGRERCSNCNKSIPVEIQRLRFYETRPAFPYSRKRTHKNICGNCLLQMFQQLDKKRIYQWIQDLVVKKL